MDSNGFLLASYTFLQNFIDTYFLNHVKCKKPQYKKNFYLTKKMYNFLRLRKDMHLDTVFKVINMVAKNS